MAKKDDRVGIDAQEQQKLAEEKRERVAKLREERADATGEIDEGTEAPDPVGSPAHPDTPDTGNVFPEKTPIGPEPKPEERGARTFEKGSGVKHYRCVGIPGLSVAYGNLEQNDPTDLKRVRFVPYLERYQGENRRVGYLATAEKEVIEKLENDGNVEEISSGDFKKATEGDDVQPVQY